MRNLALSLLADIQIDPNQVKVPKGDLTSGTVTNALQLVFGLAGAIALVVVIIGGLQYVISQGNPQSTAKAKDVVMYALIGLVICATAYSLVTFVLVRV